MEFSLELKLISLRGVLTMSFGKTLLRFIQVPTLVMDSSSLENAHLYYRRPQSASLQNIYGHTAKSKSIGLYFRHQERIRLSQLPRVHIGINALTPEGNAAIEITIPHCWKIRNNSKRLTQKKY